MVIGRRFKAQATGRPGLAMLPPCDWSAHFETRPTAFHLAGAAANVASLVKRSKKMLSVPGVRDFP